MAAPILAGTTLHPSKVSREDAQNGKLHEAADGTRTWQQREGATQKRIWTLTWEKVSAYEVSVIAGLVPSTTSSFTDPFGVVYTVTRGEDSFQFESSAILTNTTEAYDVTLKLYQS